jgi:hypothetical protein
VIPGNHDGDPINSSQTPLDGWVAYFMQGTAHVDPTSQDAPRVNDNFHSGTARMADAVQNAINDSRRVPNMVLTAHVHNYQRIERPVAGDGKTPFFVIGLGGYYNLHKLNATVGTTDPATQASLIAADDTHWGYATLTVDAQNITGTVTLTPNVGETGATTIDTFLILPEHNTWPMA